MENKPPIFLEGYPPLNTYFVFLTDECNLACRHCWLTASFQRQGHAQTYLDYDLFALAIEQGMPLGLSSVKLTGGEPLMHPDFKRMVTLLKEKGINTTMETNGVLLTPAIARFLREESILRHISVSLDGAQAATHDSFRNIKGSFAASCRAISNLAEVGYRPQIIMSVHRNNIKEIEALIQLSEKLGAGSVKLGIIQPEGRAELLVKQDSLLDMQELISLGKWVQSDLSKRTSIPVTFNWPMVFFDIQKLLSADSFQCDLFGTLGILPNGFLSLCGHGALTSDLCLGLLGKDNLVDIWTSHPILVKLREDIPLQMEGVCARCLLRNQCKGGCVAENYRRTGRLTAPYWFCHLADQEGLFPLPRSQT